MSCFCSNSKKRSCDLSSSPICHSYYVKTIIFRLFYFKIWRLMRCSTANLIMLVVVPLNNSVSELRRKPRLNGKLKEVDETKKCFSRRKKKNSNNNLPQVPTESGIRRIAIKSRFSYFIIMSNKSDKFEFFLFIISKYGGPQYISFINCKGTEFHN